MSLKAIIFDVDDTLVYTIETAYKKTYLAGKLTSGIELDKEDFLRLYNKRSFEECVEYWFPDKEDTFMEHYSKIDLAYAHVEDIRKLLTIASRHNLLKGIVTNSTEVKTQRKLRSSINEFDFVYCNAQKPNLGSINEIKLRYKLSSAEILYIGDSDKDYLFSTAAGIHFCAVNTGAKSWNQSDVFYLQSVSDIESVIIQINDNMD